MVIASDYQAPDHIERIRNRRDSGGGTPINGESGQAITLFVKYCFESFKISGDITLRIPTFSHMLGSYSVVVKKSYTIILVIALKLSTAIEIPLSIGFDWILGRWVSSKQENHHEEKISFNLSLSESCLHSNVVSSIPFSWTSRQRYR